MTHKQPVKRQQAGFTLIMVSILLTVAALIFVSVLPGQEAGDGTQKASNSTKKLERVEEAMRSFMAANGRRPCPADGQYAVNTANFGIEAATPGTCTGGTPAAPLGPDAGTGNVVGGNIPTKTLGLPDEYAFDEYGRRFTYLVDKRVTDSVTTAIGHSRVPGCYSLQQSIKLTASTHPGIIIKNSTSGTIIDYTMYAYISHGASGYGAYPAQGASSPAGRINSGSTDGDMQTNAGVDAHFPGASAFTYNTTNFTNVLVQKDRVTPVTGDTGFDDVTWYRPDLKNNCSLTTTTTNGTISAAGLQTGFIANGANTSDTTGYSLAVGDVNGDGIPDLIIGAPNTATGTVYVVFGTKAGFPDPLPLGTALTGTKSLSQNWS